MKTQSSSIQYRSIKYRTIKYGAIWPAFCLLGGMAMMEGCTKPSSASKRAVQPPLTNEALVAQSSYRIRYDQLGYLPSHGSPSDAGEAAEERFAVVVSAGLPAPRYRIEDESTHAPLTSGTAGPRVLDVTSRAGTPLTGDRIDLSGLKPGRYSIVLEDGSRTDPFSIDKNVYAPVIPLVAKFLAEQRCGATTKEISLHAACHLFASVGHAHAGDGIVVDDGTPPPYSGPPFNAEGGWHDAGDYIKFVGTSAYVLAVELMTLRDHPTAFGAASEALAVELRWGLDWLLKMVTGPDPHHQVGGEGDHDAGWRLPEGDTQTPVSTYDQRPVFRMAAGHGRNLLGRSAAAFVFGAQVYGARDPAYAQKLRAAAEAAYAAAKIRAAIQNPDPSDFYEERSGDDDLVLAAAALARLTNKSHYATDAYSLGTHLTKSVSVTGWDSLDALALLEAGRAFPAGSRERGELAQRLGALAAPLAATAKTPVGAGRPFGYALPDFGNGSIAESLGAAATCLASRELTGTAGCDVVAKRQLHWMLGENPFGMSFLVGAGAKWPQNVHHSFGIAAHIAIPGAMPGGPTTLKTLTGSELPAPPKDDPYAAYSTDELLYEDRTDNYICNEPAIDFAAALVFVLGELAEET